MLTIVVPVLNEAAVIEDSLAALQPLRQKGAEVLLVDGGSRDDTLALAEPWVDQVLVSGPGRARQMNLGASQALGETLLFLHADTRLPTDSESWLPVVEKAAWGFFDVRLSNPSLPFRIIGTLMNRRSRLSGVGTGDQCLFVKADLFHAAGGFPVLDLMEDVALSKHLRRRAGRPARPPGAAVTSSRRWEQGGIARTVVLMWVLRLAFALGVPAARLVRLYR